MFNKGWNNLLPGVTSFQTVSVTAVSPDGDKLNLSLYPQLSVRLFIYFVRLNSGETESVYQLRPPGGSIAQLLWRLGRSGSVLGGSSGVAVAPLLPRWTSEEKFSFFKKKKKNVLFNSSLYTVCLSSNLAGGGVVTFHIFKVPALRLTLNF